MTNGTPDYALGKASAADKYLTDWLGRVEQKVDNLQWKVAGLATIVPVLTTFIVLFATGQV